MLPSRLPPVGGFLGYTGVFWGMSGFSSESRPARCVAKKTGVASRFVPDSGNNDWSGKWDSVPRPLYWKDQDEARKFGRLPCYWPGSFSVPSLHRRQERLPSGRQDAVGGESEADILIGVRTEGARLPPCRWRSYVATCSTISAVRTCSYRLPSIRAIGNQIAETMMPKMASPATP